MNCSRILQIGLLISLSPICLMASAFEGNESDGTTEKGIHYWDGKPISITIEDGLIVSIERPESVQLPTVYIAPGFIDHQVNGYLSYSFSRKGLTVEQIRKISQSFWENGITTYLPTLTSQSFELLLENFSIMREAMKDPEIQLSIPGLHLEGPYISPEDGFRGAHNKQWIRPPDWEEFRKWYDASGGNIMEVSLAPELDGANDFIKKCRQLNIVVALAHHNGSARIIKEAVDAGASVSTHLGNGCANYIHRHDNPLWPQLADDRLMASLIVDGYHLRKEEVQTFYKVKGPDRTLLVSDVTMLGGMPPGRYELFGVEVVMTEQGKITMPSQDVLAGASYLITTGIENIMAFTGCSLGEAVNMASRNPARLLGLDDRGEIEVGKRADLVYFTMEGGKIQIQKTILAGKVVFDREVR